MKATAAKLCCILGISFVAGNVDANPNAMTISGASFDDWTSEQCVSRWNGGISNSCSGDTNFIYGIPKGPSRSGYRVTFAGHNNSTSVSASYAVFSYSSTGEFLRYQQGSVGGVTDWTGSVSFSATQAPASGRLTAFVGLPGNSQGSLYGITVAY